MTARSRPEDIEYISRLKFGSQFNYTPEHHSKEDIDVDNYWHNISTRYLAAAEMKAISGPCPRDTVIVANCSAVKRMVIDYGDLRQRIRAAREKD